MCDHDPNILQAGEHGDNHPGDKQALIPSIGSNNKEEGTKDSEKGVKHRVLDQWANADVLALTLLGIWVKELGVLDDVENGGDYRYEEFDHADDDDARLQRNTEARGEARSGPHFQN